MTEQESGPPSLAADALSKGDSSSDMCAQVLAHSFVTPLEARRPGVLVKDQRANYFVLGAYKCLPRKGITKLTNGTENFAIGLGNYSGGDLFVEAEGGSFPFEDPCTGEWLWVKPCVES